jgi:hypothetical protein
VNDKQYWGGSAEEAKASHQWHQFVDQSGTFEFIHENGKVIIRKVDSMTQQEQFQDAIQKAVDRMKKNRRTYALVRFTNEQGGMRYRIYADTKNGFKAFQHCKVGERIELIGYANKCDSDWRAHPLPFWPQSKFKAEYEALPVMQEWEAYINPTQLKLPD